MVDFWITGVTWGPGPGAATRTRTVWRAAGPRAARAMATPGTGERRERGAGVMLQCLWSKNVFICSARSQLSFNIPWCPECTECHITPVSCLRSSSRDCPPQLPPRDGGLYSGQGGLWATGADTQARSQTSIKKEKKKTGDDPYYFGLSARIPNFVKSRKKKQKERNRATPGQVQFSELSSTIT